MKEGRTKGSDCGTWRNAWQARPNRIEKCTHMSFIHSRQQKLNGPWIYVSACIKFNHQRNGTNLHQVAWASDVSDGQMRCVDVEEVGVVILLSMWYCNQYC